MFQSFIQGTKSFWSKSNCSYSNLPKVVFFGGKNVSFRAEDENKFRPEFAELCFQQLGPEFNRTFALAGTEF